ncbi:unnamed protein product [Oppiella nova]|uniref:1-(5-phosphoribosyl)-5-((5-phosphoribosylamino)methylideneamino)imidazole-4-carboxamide isomerase n=1 Tax=Oppiella nova TaxID=334625 RepID=A0A7R9MKE9_9ACAR|nr:unnamed protein product [Oppiella nova]CAG2178928.1 unnamed protein product [Oppiella nova]
MLIIPAIDLKDAQHWVNEGARRLHLVDLNGAFAGTPIHKPVVEAIAKAQPELPIQIGGGIRSLETIEHYLDAGVSFVIIGTKAVQNPEFVEEACKKFAGHIIVGIDAINGVSSIVYTDIARDGLPVIASGGVTNLDDVRNLKGKPGILGAITGRAIYEGTLNLREAQLLLDDQGF